VNALPVLILGAVLVALLVGFGAFYRYSRTDAWRHGEVRRATFELLLVIGPFFGVHPKPPEPEPPAVLTPRGDRDDPMEGQYSIPPGDSSDAEAPER
jgi:hypothetical protein